jgi:hypothetical protein
MTGAKSRQPPTATTVIVDSESTSANPFAARPPSFLDMTIAAGEFPPSTTTSGARFRMPSKKSSDGVQSPRLIKSSSPLISSSKRFHFVETRLAPWRRQFNRRLRIGPKWTDSGQMLAGFELCGLGWDRGRWPTASITPRTTPCPGPDVAHDSSSRGGVTWRRREALPGARLWNWALSPSAACGIGRSPTSARPVHRARRQLSR